MVNNGSSCGDPSDVAPARRAAGKLAFTIVVHKAPEQVVRLASAVAATGNYCVIHCNARSGAAFRDTIERGLADAGIDRVRFLESEPVAWGSGSILRVQMRAIDALLDWADDWTHFINLSGQCLPTKPLAEIERYLADHQGQSFFECIDLESERPDLGYRYSHYYIEVAGKPRNTHIPRLRPRGFRPFFGAFWVILSHEASRYVARSDEAHRIRRYLQYTMFPDELAFQTILLNSPLKSTIVPDMKRLILWEGGSPNPTVLTMQHWPRIDAPDHLFARKFDHDQDAAVIARLGDRIGCHLAVGSLMNA